MRPDRRVRTTCSEDASEVLAPHPQPSNDNHAPSRRSLRGRSGCLNCRRRRKKCDELKPTCAKCKRLGEQCQWDSGLSFRVSSLQAGHPSMLAGHKAAASVATLHMVDVTFDSATHQSNESLNGQEFVMAHDSVDDESPPRLDHGNSDISWDMEANQNEPGTSSNEHVLSTHDLISPESHRHQSIQDPLSVNSLPIIREDDDVGGFSLPELGPLDYLTDRDAFQAFGGSLWPPLSNDESNVLMDLDHITSESPDMYSMYYPNAAYRELHATLYNHMVETAKGTGFTRVGTPDSGKSNNGAINQDTSTRTTRWNTDDPETSLPRGPPNGMTARREMELWRNYIDEIARWLDMFDNDRHFQVHLTLLAENSEPLRYSILALSARQIERKDPNKPYTESLGLYQEAIRLIAADLEAMSTEVIGSCVLLCVLEMMSSSPKDWSRHLNGAAMLIKAAGINGVVGGMRQAIFWCFARMDMWGGFLSQSHTKIPTSLWFLPTGSMSTAITRFKTDFQDFDSYANYSLFLCASVLNVVSHRGTSVERASTYTAKWKALFDLLVDWHTNRPLEMRPLTLRADEKEGDASFPIVLYANTPSISANQLYHTATLLMLQEKPNNVKIRGQRSIFWHARQVVGISVSNLSHGAWCNALQPLYLAGKVMSSKAEHRVVLDILGEIEKSTGFATQWRAQDLKEYWGDEAD